MSERAASTRTKKSKLPESVLNDPGLGKPEKPRPPPRKSTVQQLRERLQQINLSGRRGRGEAKPPPSRRAGEESATSRDSSPGITDVPPPSTTASLPPPPSPPRKPAKRTAAQMFRELARCKAEQDEEVKRWV